MTCLSPFAARALLLGMAATLAGCATTGGPQVARTPDSLTAGRDANGEPCVASRNWRDHVLADPFDAGWSLTCRGAAAARNAGSVRIVATPAAAAAVEATFACGAASAVRLPGLGDGSARLCSDPGLGTTALVLSGSDGDRRVIGSALPSAGGPLALAMQRLAGGGGAAAGDDPLPPPVALSSLAPAPAATGEQTGSAETNLQAALARGISLNHKGLHAEASRLLNDAVSRITPRTPAQLQAELALEAGLADSNIEFADSAAAHFARADRIMSGDDGVRTAFLIRKRDAYAALDLMNRGDYRGALAAMDRLSARMASADNPLRDTRMLGLLNSPRRSDGTASAVGGSDGALLSSLALESTVNWARSVTYLGLGDDAAAKDALLRASTDYDALLGRNIEQGALLWIGARIDRQAARIAVRERDFGRALALYDRAIDGLRLGALGTAGTGNEPVVAETMLERADALARSGTPRDQVRSAYAEAVDAVLSSGSGSVASGFGIDRYLDLLVQDVAAGGQAGDDAAERYFRALQSIGAPAVARQLGQLQSEVAADPALGVRIRDRADLEREITRLRYAIADAPDTPGSDVAALEAQRAAAEARLTEVETALAGDARYSRVDDSPATLADLRAALGEGEAYWALDEVAGRMFGLLVTRGATRAWAVEAPVSLLDQFGERIRSSVDGRLNEGKLVPFDVAASFALFKLLAGPGEADILAARALVIDPGGPLENLPATLLVTDRASVDARRGISGQAEFDFTRTAFLGRAMPIGTSVSPRSFLVSRSLPASRATRDFLGFAAHEVLADGGGMVAVGPSCSVPLSDVSALSRQLKPIARREVDLAARALGDPGVPVVTGAQFTDAGIAARTDIADYKILHFATHGLTEGSWGCRQSPPALVTSLVPGSDGLLSFDEIARLRLDANLVVLSACDTSAGVRSETLARQAGQEEAGAQLEGLVRAFLTANARSVLATYWPVSAESDADLFVERFYATARGASIGEALRSAQIALMTEPRSSHPFYWAPYFVVGDPSKNILAGSAAAAGSH